MVLEKNNPTNTDNNALTTQPSGPNAPVMAPTIAEAMKSMTKKARYRSQPILPIMLMISPKANAFPNEFIFTMWTMLMNAIIPRKKAMMTKIRLKSPSAKIHPALRTVPAFVILLNAAKLMKGMAITRAITAIMSAQIIATMTIFKPSTNISVYLSSLGAFLEAGLSRIMRA